MGTVLDMYPQAADIASPVPLPELPTACADRDDLGNTLNELRNKAESARQLAAIDAWIQDPSFDGSCSGLFKDDPEICNARRSSSSMDEY